MTWQSPSWRAFHRRGDVLSAVIAAADTRQDGILPMDVPGVQETFADELALLGALQLRWHTRLAGRIERELLHQPMDLEQAVIAAWRATHEQMPGVRRIIDHYRSQPTDAAMAEAMRTATAKEQAMLAAMSGRASIQDASAIRVGETIERRARAGVPAGSRPGAHRADPRPNHDGLLERIKAVLAA